ncbi:DUF6308 family protein [Kitasatospora sp. NPDC088346]|uniref:DUF6308 family protein n=1 Tax=Kitasatospora sp. NPDC088346 TaxID=3364073 RepID=UPI003803618C
MAIPDPSATPFGERLRALLSRPGAVADLRRYAGIGGNGFTGARFEHLAGGGVTAGKLLARKRPRLLPVYDRVVRCAVGRPASFWLSLRDALAADGRALHRHLLDLRTAAALPGTVSALRVCDIVVWMGHRADHRPTGCPGPAF